MGNSSSSSPVVPEPSPTFSAPWRNVSWGNNENLQFAKNYKPDNGNVTHLRILLYGPIGFGKSSFINSVSSTLQGQIDIPAVANAKRSATSQTKKYESHKIRKGTGIPKTYCSFIFNDIMGLEKDNSNGVHPDDIKLALQGCVKEGHLFNPVSPLSISTARNQPPSPDDKVHVLVCVLSANVSEIDSSILQKMANIREAASDLGIPQMAIVTKIDEACGEVQKDLKNVYKSKHLKQKMKDFSAETGIPMNCIFPVKNYSEEIAVDDDVDTLILSALRCMLNFGDNFIDKL